MSYSIFSQKTVVVKQGVYQTILLLLLSSLFLFKGHSSFAQPFVQVVLSGTEVTSIKTKEAVLIIDNMPLTVSDELVKHRSLAQQYAKDGKFELAYLEKKEYLKKYRLLRKEQRHQISSALTKDFEIDEKAALNKSLKNKNELKLLRVAAIQKQKQDQQYYFTVIISIACVFILLYFRKLMVRNKLIKLASIDSLTELANRGSLFEYGQKLTKEFKNEPYDFSILLLDLDHFKIINDTFGHQVGDQILIVIADLINETMRSRDVLARLGGDEFVALLPFADGNKAKAIAMRISEKIMQHNFSSVGCNNKITLSIGVASMAEGSNFDDLLHRADLAMYQAKNQGRNKVVSYQNIASMQERRGI